MAFIVKLIEWISSLKYRILIDGIAMATRTKARFTREGRNEIEIARKYYQAIMGTRYRYSRRYNVVPVVYGGANYTQFAPPNSYVNAMDFESPKELAAYLKYLSQDLRQYQSFLQWKKYYRVNHGTKRAVCTLCEVLHKQKEPTVYSILSDWYTKDKCPIQTLLRNSGDKYATKITLQNRT
jgi:hypothetical protein